jgi:hypothetical protein
VVAGVAGWRPRELYPARGAQRSIEFSMHNAAVMIRRHGGPEVLEVEPVDAVTPGPGELRLCQTFESGRAVRPVVLQV